MDEKKGRMVVSLKVGGGWLHCGKRVLDLVTAAALLHTRGAERWSGVAENLDSTWNIYKADKMP
eukprot:7431939-Ditylum_brightwellii.AAC.1